MRIALKVIVVICNLVIIILAARWFSEENFFEPIIVILGQVASLLSISFDLPRKAVFSNLKRGKYDVTMSGSGEFTAKDHEDTEIKHQQ